MIFLKYKILMWWNDFQRFSFGKSFKFFFFILIGFILLYSLYAGFYRLLAYLTTIPYIGELLIIKLISMAFLWMFFMVIISSLIAGFSTIYFSSELHLWMASPIPAARIFLWKAIETAWYASWMIVLALVPFIGAYASVKQLDQSFYLFFMLVLIPFLAIAASAGIAAGTLLVSVFPHKRLRDAIMVLVIIAGSGLYIAFRLMQPEALVRPDVFEKVLQYVAVVQAPTAVYAPSWWVTAAIGAFTAKRWYTAVQFVAVLYGAAIVCVAGVLLLGMLCFFKGWAFSQEGAPQKKREKFPLKTTGKPSPGFSIMRKDIIIFFRDVNQWSQLLLLSALVAVYLFSIYKLPLDTVYLKSLVSYLNIGMIGFVLSAISLRFVFPALSLEGRSYWILASSPLPPIKIMWVKFLYSLPVILIVGILLSVISNTLLQVERFFWIGGLGSVVLIAVTLSGMGTGMGSSFPCFRTENIARIEGSPGGILYMLCAFFYVGLLLSLIAVPMRMYYMSRTDAGYAVLYGILIAAWAVLLLVSAVFFGFSFWYGKRTLESYEG